MTLFELDFKPENDGIDHINIYSKGKTLLGRMLSNFAYTPFEMQIFGRFNSVEGLWYWLGTDDDKLRELSGYEAKKYGQSLRQLYDLPKHVFEGFVKDAFRNKLEAHPDLKSEFIASELPFTHYYVFNGEKKEAGFEWQIEEWERLRKELKNGK